MVKESRQNRRAAELLPVVKGSRGRWLLDRKREDGDGPYALILAIPRLVKSTVRQFESLCEPFIYCLSRLPFSVLLSVSLPPPFLAQT